MSTTLTNGLKLPDKGSVDWYADMQSNYAILDGAVGTIAEHTAALSGKAPLVHTHTKSDITDFPAYGNTAGTICEGNDSRLSDARTPVAHTHTKSDVTDLFNSANTWTGENKYTSGFILSNISWSGVTPPSSAKPTVIEFKNSDTRQGRYINRISSTSSETWIETIRNVDANTSYNHTVILKVDNSGNKSVYPSSNNDVDLGIAVNQWNNLYAKNYYYNGVAWGLDKQNEWTASQTLSSNSFFTVRGYRFRIKNDSMILGTVPSSNQWTGMQFTDKNDRSISEIVQSFQSNGNSLYQVNIFPNEANSEKRSVISYAYNTTNNVNNVTLSSNLIPNSNNTYDLGTSTNKWKTLNGINPGALSLPDTLGTSGTENVNYFNVIGYLNNTGTLATIPSTATYDGWLYINAKDGTDSYIIIDDSPASFGTSVFGNNGLGAQGIGLLCLICPIRKGHSYNVRIKSAGIVSARIYPAQGNV